MVYVTDMVGFTAIKRSISQDVFEFAKLTWYLSSEWERLTLPVLCNSESCIEIKINLNFYFHTLSWCLKRFQRRPSRAVYFAALWDNFLGLKKKKKKSIPMHTCF